MTCRDDSHSALVGTALCRLCRADLTLSPTVSVGPFPKAAQYYPTSDEFSADKGTILQLVTCKQCNLTQLLNDPVDYFKSVISAASNSPTLSANRITQFQAIAQQLNRKTRPTAIEIGCGSGDNISLLEKSGFSARGTEYIPRLQKPKSSSPDILNTYILDLTEEHDAQYDLVVSFNYLEHQPDTRAFLLKCHDILSETGRLLLTVPNLEHLLSSRAAHEFVTDHLVYFTPHSLCSALHITGFGVQDLCVINGQYDIQVVAQKSHAHSIESCKDSLEELVRQLNDRLRFFASQGLRVAVWGAGHRTLALLSLCEHQLITLVLDSAVFKHNKFTPLSHLKIVSPEILSLPGCGVDVILVMVPGIYPAEVMSKIRSLPVQYAVEQFPPPPEPQ